MSVATNVIELRDADEARHVIVQSYLLQRLQTPHAAGIANVLECAAELAGAGTPFPSLGVLADLSTVLLRPTSISTRQTTVIPGWSDQHALSYEDRVLGKWLADTSLERAGDALRQYDANERTRGLAFVFTQLRLRAGFGGLLLSPGALKKLRDQPPERLLADAWESVEHHGLAPALVECCDDLVHHVRKATSMLGPEDVFELEHRTALTEFSQRVALRQVLQATAALSAALPAQLPALSRTHREVASHLRDEDAYPVGGFTSLSNRGSVESLLHSQLAFMEDDRPDLFDVKFVRDELLYYSRDENQFFRRRRTFVIAFFPDLIHARVKDPAAPWQRIVFLLGAIHTLVERATKWLGNESLSFELVFLADEIGNMPLESEQRLLETVFRTQIADGYVRVSRLDDSAPWPLCELRARRSLVDVLQLGSRLSRSNDDAIDVGSVVLDAPIPQLSWQDDMAHNEGNSQLECWRMAVEQILHRWIHR